MWGCASTLISTIRRQLHRALPEGYVAPIQERVYVELAPDPDVVVNLQAALEDAYEEGQYHQVINYAADCPAPLPPDGREWVHNFLHDKVLRK